MKNFSKFIFVLVVTAIAGGGFFLATWEIPAPVTDIERVLPDDRFPK